MKCSFGISNFLEEISSLSHSIVFLYFFALTTEEGFLISPCYSLELCIQIGVSFLFSFAFHFSSFLSYSKIPYSKGLFWPFFFGVVVLFYLVVSFIFLFLIIFFYFYSLHFVIAMLLLACFPLPLFSFFCCSSVLPCCSCFTYIFTFPNIFLIFTTLFCFLFFCYCTVLSFLLPHHAACRILVPRLGVRREILW